MSDEDLETWYAYPPDAERWLRANFVVSADGFVSLDGSSVPLSGPADRRVIGMLRALADVVLVGAGTARAEDYRPVAIGAARAEIRSRHGLSAAPPMAVVTRGLDLDLDGPLFAPVPAAPTIIVTTTAAHADRLAEARQVADVIVHEGEIDFTLLLHQLASRGMQRVLCEGGPSLLTDLLQLGLVDELCLTLSPFLVASSSERRLTGPLRQSLPLTLAGSRIDGDFTFQRYLAQR